VMLYSYSYFRAIFRAILKISQVKGLRDPGVGVPLSPFALLARLGIEGKHRYGVDGFVTFVRRNMGYLELFRIVVE